MNVIRRIDLTDGTLARRMETMTTTWPTNPAATPTRPASPDPVSNPWLQWRTERPEERTVLSSAELAECRCPDFCDRDHGNE